MSEFCYPFTVVGFSLVTTTEQAMKENSIGHLWVKFHQSGLAEKLPALTSKSIFAVYSDYENQHFGRYRLTIGYAVENTESIPEGCEVVEVVAGHYHVFQRAAIRFKTLWRPGKQVWNRDAKAFPRAYQTDMEEYQEDGQVRLHIGYH